jgi:hypothetical protein
MSATTMAIVPPEHLQDFRNVPRGDRWWERLIPTCAQPDCPHRGKLWPTRLRRARGVFFEGRWYCELACLRTLLDYRVRHLLSGFLAQKARPHRIPLGLLLVRSGAISTEQLREALLLQRQGGAGRLGDWFLQTGAISEEQLTAALSQQWGCPVFPLEQQQAHPSWSGLLPLSLLESARAVPAHASVDARVLHLAFADRLDHTLLYAIERMLACRTIGCVAPGSAVTDSLSQLRRRAERTETIFDSIRDAREMSWTICNYAGELRAARVAIARVTAHIWVRFYRREASRDLLFRVLPESGAGFPNQRASGRPKVSQASADTRKDGVPDAAEPL